MKCSIILLLCVWVSQFVLAQQRDPSIILYDRGNAAVARKDYRTADSLFTLSLNLAPHPDSYYNRAVCRRQLNNFKGYCLDLNEAADMGDKESYNLYWKQCAKKDTIYKKNDGEFAAKNSFEYIELVTSYKYNTDFDYSKHDTTGNCIVTKQRIDNVVFYRSCKEVKEAMYKGEIDSLVEYIRSNQEFSTYVKRNDLFEIIYVKLTIDENGKVINVEKQAPIINDGYDELKKVLLNMPNWNPALYNNKGVKFKHELTIKFYNNVVEIMRIGSFVTKVSEIFSPVETMPDFPGGAMEMMKFIQKAIVYPQIAKEVGVNGKCYLKFVVNADGKISDIRVEKGVLKCPACDAEAVRVIKSMPPWKPGTQNGKPVSVFFNLPINFQLR